MTQIRQKEDNHSTCHYVQLQGEKRIQGGLEFFDMRHVIDWLIVTPLTCIVSCNDGLAPDLFYKANHSYPSISL